MSFLAKFVFTYAIEGGKSKKVILGVLYSDVVGWCSWRTKINIGIMIQEYQALGLLEKKTYVKLYRLSTFLVTKKGASFAKKSKVHTTHSYTMLAIKNERV